MRHIEMSEWQNALHRCNNNDFNHTAHKHSGGARCIDLIYAPPPMYS